MKHRLQADRRRWLPSPLLSVALFALWLLLNSSFSPGQLVLGTGVALIAPMLSRTLLPPPSRLRRPGVALRLLVVVLRDIVAWNLRVARGSLLSPWRPPRTGFVTVPLALRDPSGLAVLSIIVSGVPGTVWCELAADSSELTLHVFDLDDPDQFVSTFKSRYERPLLEIFG